VPEEPNLYNHLSGAEYLIMAAQLRGLPGRETSERIDGLLRLLSRYDDRHASIMGCSKGMRQKVLMQRRCRTTPIPAAISLKEHDYRVGKRLQPRRRRRPCCRPELAADAEC
jgi:hypothetical protein